MNNPWDIKPSDIRLSDSIPNFIIFCEDKVSESEYLKYFETEKIKVNFVKEQKSMLENVLRALHHCNETGLTESVNGMLQIAEGDTQVWCVYDRDKARTGPVSVKDDIAFDESIAIAEGKGIRVAWSNDSFELWVLLHFEDLSYEDPTLVNRDAYYERLTEYFRNHPNPNEDLVKVLSHSSYSYKRDLKSKNNFKSIVRSEMIPRTRDAINRSKILEEALLEIHSHNHKKCPCTMMHYLVEELITLGGKEF